MKRFVFSANESFHIPVETLVTAPTTVRKSSQNFVTDVEKHTVPIQNLTKLVFYPEDWLEWLRSKLPC